MKYITKISESNNHLLHLGVESTIYHNVDIKVKSPVINPQYAKQSLKKAVYKYSISRIYLTSEDVNEK